MINLRTSMLSGDIGVQRFRIAVGTDRPFMIVVHATSGDHALDLSAGFRGALAAHAEAGQGGATDPLHRAWSGIISHAEQIHAVPTGNGQTGASTYLFRLVPDLYRLTLRTDNRIFQHRTIPDIIDEILKEWSILYTWHIDRKSYPKLEYKVQYDESDYALFSRLLEEAGIAFTFVADEQGRSILTMSDRLEAGPLRQGPPIPYVDNPNQSAQKEYITRVRLVREARPGTLALRDYDPRHPTFTTHAEATPVGPEAAYEQFYYDAGAFLAETGAPAGTPVADAHGFARHDRAYGKALAERMLHADRVGAHLIAFESNAYDLAPGSIFSIDNHPHDDLPASRRLLVVETTLECEAQGEWRLKGLAVPADIPYRPPRRTPKPKIYGVQTAKVTGPTGQEIHTDEMGRIRVEFPWDRAGHHDDRSSCWVRVAEGWGASAFGMVTLPRIGQEVILTFLEGDPDQPIVLGRTYNALEQVPYRLPQHHTRSTWKSRSSPDSHGYNELMFEDNAGAELVWQHAERDRTRVVEHDERAAVIHNRRKLVKNDETEHTDGERRRWVGKDQDVLEKQERRERIEADHHLDVRGARREHIRGDQSLTVEGDQEAEIGGSFALRAANQVHEAGHDIVGEGREDVTVKGPGGFLRIDAAGVTIAGTLVKINVTGKPGKGRGAKPALPDEPAGPTVTKLRWGRSKVRVGEKVEAIFELAGFLGGEPVELTVYEHDADGTATRVDTIKTTVSVPNGSMKIPWERSKDAAESDLLQDEKDGDVGPLEYRFSVRAGVASSRRRSDALWLTNTVEVTLAAPGGGTLEGQEMQVTVMGPDGTAKQAVTKTGKAKFDDMVVGPIKIDAKRVKS
jgi:type VI secretion system secreted protein VgrG